LFLDALRGRDDYGPAVYRFAGLASHCVDSDDTLLKLQRNLRRAVQDVNAIESGELDTQSLVMLANKRRGSVSPPLMLKSVGAGIWFCAKVGVVIARAIANDETAFIVIPPHEVSFAL
jgi:hypothetical protein